MIFFYQNRVDLVPELGGFFPGCSSVVGLSFVAREEAPLLPSVLQMVHAAISKVKFIYSEKATKLRNLTPCSKVKMKGRK